MGPNNVQHTLTKRGYVIRAPFGGMMIVTAQHDQFARSHRQCFPCVRSLKSLAVGIVSRSFLSLPQCCKCVSPSVCVCVCVYFFAHPTLPGNGREIQIKKRSCAGRVVSRGSLVVSGLFHQKANDASNLVGTESNFFIFIDLEMDWVDWGKLTVASSV